MLDLNLYRCFPGQFSVHSCLWAVSKLCSLASCSIWADCAAEVSGLASTSVTCATCFVNTGGAVCFKELAWSVLPRAIEETSYRLWILARAEARLNVGVVDNFQLAISWLVQLVCQLDHWAMQSSIDSLGKERYLHLKKLSCAGFLASVNIRLRIAWALWVACHWCSLNSLWLLSSQQCFPCRCISRYMRWVQSNKV